MVIGIWRTPLAPVESICWFKPRWIASCCGSSMEGVNPRAEYKPAFHEGTPLQLLQVHALFRHGDRSPTPLGEAKARAELWIERLEEVPAILPHHEYYIQQHPWGRLTKKGAEQARALGAWLREHYLPALCGLQSLTELRSPEKVIHIRSTNFLRTHMTGWFVLEGLLGSPEAPASIPITIRDFRTENLYHNNHCPRLAKRWRAAWKTARDFSTNWQAHYKDMQIAMAKFLDFSIDAPACPLLMDSGFPWVTAVDAIECGRYHGDPAPEGVTDAQIIEVRGHLAHRYAASFQDREILQLSMGRLVKEIVDALLVCAHGSSSGSPDLFLYSGHDATLLELSVALGERWPSWPAYTSSICIELWQIPKGDQQFVRVLYDGQEIALPMCLGHEKDSRKTLLTLDEFYELAKGSMISEEDYKCQCQCQDLDELEKLSVSSL